MFVMGNNFFSSFSFVNFDNVCTHVYKEIVMLSLFIIFIIHFIYNYDIYILMSLSFIIVILLLLYISGSFVPGIVYTSLEMAN